MSGKFSMGDINKFLAPRWILHHFLVSYTILKNGAVHLSFGGGKSGRKGYFQNVCYGGEIKRNNSGKH